MVKDSIEVDDLEANEDKDTKYMTASLSKSDDADLIKRYNRLRSIGGFSTKEVFEAGVNALVGSEQYKSALRAIQKELA